MFTELMLVIADRPLTITVASVADGKLRVCVIPQSQEKDGAINGKVTNPKEVAKIPETSIKALTTPLVLTGTAEELDAGLVKELTTYAGSHVQLQHGIAQATMELTDALKAIEERNKTNNPKAKAKADAKKVGPDKPTDGDHANEGGEQKPASPTLPLAWCTASENPVSAQDDGSDKRGADGEVHEEGVAQ